jgi:hypothetical protein
MEFYCVECGQLVRTPLSAAGKRGKCPNCKELIDIPRKPAGSKSSGSLPRHTPRTPTQDLTPLEELEPLDLPPLQPSYAPPSDLAPLLDEVLPPLGSLPGASLPPSAWPPSASGPSAAGAMAPAPRKRLVEVGRRGLPWERDPSVETFFETVRYVIGSPGEAFLTMTRRGIGSPIGYFLISNVIGNLIFIILFKVLQFLSALYVVLTVNAEGLYIKWDLILISFARAALAMVVLGFFSGAVLGLMASMVFHVTLLALGAANAGFATTCRTVCFSLGSLYMLASIPAAGPPIALLLLPIVLTYAFMNAHETSGGRAFLAAVIPSGAVLSMLGLFVLANWDFCRRVAETLLRFISH